MYTIFVIGSMGLTVALSWATYKSGRLLRAVPIRENLLLAPVENMVKGILVLLCIGLGVLSGAGPSRLGWTLDNGWRDLALGILAGLFTQLVANGFTNFAIKKWGKDIYSPVVMKNIMPRTRLEWLLVPAALGLGVLLEELLFRSLLLGALSITVPLPILIIGFSAIFGLMHSPQGTLGVMVTGLLGMWLSLLFVWSGGLLLPLVAHYIINLLQLLRAQVEKSWLDTY
jgi:membrane protease YdiL (CAAX protease family)